jgi:pyruvate,orthophosphate dikinase
VTAYDLAKVAPDATRYGRKAAALATLAAQGLRIPEGFVLDASACDAFHASGDGRLPPAVDRSLQAALAALEKRTGLALGDAERPLLLALRSSPPVDLPGTLDSVLDLGLSEDLLPGLAARGGDRFAWDTWRRFIEGFGDLVLGVHYTQLSRATQDFLAEEGDGATVEALPVDRLRALCRHLVATVERHGLTFPRDPREQIRLAVAAAYRAWNGHRARYFRAAHQLGDHGLPLVLQRMAFGNLDAASGVGTAHTRCPTSGERVVKGVWRPTEQGAPGERGAPLSGDDDAALSLRAPAAWDALSADVRRLEARAADMLDVTFIVEAGTLWYVDHRPARRTGQAAVQAVVDLVEEGIIDRAEALRRIDPRELEGILRPVIAPDARRAVLARGLDASPGAACGRVVFKASEVREAFERQEPTILVRVETTPEDIQGMTLAAGVLTARGGQTSHAAVIARGMGKPAIVGCSSLHVDLSRELFYAGDAVVRRGDWITIDGGTGEVMEGKVEMLAPRTDAGAMATLLGWADEVARLEVRANADTGADAARARQLGAVGIGLCRTEHMFFQADALRAIRRMILADDPRARQRALQDVLPIQRSIFREIFQAMDGLPVCIRLLDPPLHEFLPGRHEELGAVAQELDVPADRLRARLAELSESNPMLGHRGVRVGVTTPDVYRTQVRALFEAACELTREGVVVVPEIMVPLVALPAELERVRALVVETAETVMASYGTSIRYEVGTMIELPRACVLAERVAAHADFFSFGTNDLTQMVWGLSRDDLGKFFPDYQRAGLWSDAPTTVFDVEGVGPFVQLGVEGGRRGRPGLPMGVCGEHAGDPRGVAFFHGIGVDYVSCSPFRVPVARLAAAHAALAAATA